MKTSIWDCEELKEIAVTLYSPRKLVNPAKEERKENHHTHRDQD